MRQTLQSTVARRPAPLATPHRTCRHRFVGGSILRDLNDTAYDEYRDAELELSRREEAIPEPDDLPPGPFSADDPRIAAVDWISVDEQGYLVVEGKAGWGDDPADIALLAELHEEARTSRPPTPGEIAYDEAHEAITDLWDTLAEQERREYTDYAENLTVAVQSRLSAVELPTAVTVNITLAPEDARGHDAYDDTRRPRIRATRSSKPSTTRSPTPLPRARSRALP